MGTCKIPVLGVFFIRKSLKLLGARRDATRRRGSRRACDDTHTPFSCRRLAVKRIQGDAWRKKKNPPKPDGVQPDRVQPDGDQPDWLSDEQHEGDCEKTEKEVLSDVFGFFVCCEAQPHDGA